MSIVPLVPPEAESAESTMTLGDDIIRRVVCGTVQYDALMRAMIFPAIRTQHRDASVDALLPLSLYRWTMLAYLNLF